MFSSFSILFAVGSGVQNAGIHNSGILNFTFTIENLVLNFFAGYRVSLIIAVYQSLVNNF